MYYTMPGDPFGRAASNRWRTDAAGYRIYHPAGPASAGYIIDDAMTEAMLLKADQRYVDWCRRVLPFAWLLALPLLGCFYWLLDAHPVAAFAFFPTLIALAGAIERRLCWRQVAALLAGAVKVPPAEPAMRRVRHAALISVAVLTVAMWLVLRTYDERLGALRTTGDTVVFYQSISGYVLSISVCVLFSVIFVTGWSGVTARHGISGALLILSLLAVVTFALGTRANAIFENPRPVIALTQTVLFCDRQIAWSDITALKVESGDHDRIYVQIRLSSGSSARCDLDHLNLDRDNIVAAIRKQWQAAAPSAASQDGVTARLPDIAASRR